MLLRASGFFYCASRASKARKEREIRREMKKQSAEGILDDLNRSRIKKDVSCLQNNAIDIGYEHRKKNYKCLMQLYALSGRNYTHKFVRVRKESFKSNKTLRI